MNKETITEMLKRFNSISKVTADGVEYWQARELMVVLGYNNWRSFENVISKAIIACETTGYDVENYFISTYKEALLGKSGIRNVSDYMLTRYACYLIAQNGDSKKDEIAFAQSYFALQTRKQELIEDRLSLNKRMETRDRLKESEKKLSQNIYERGVDEKGFGRIRSHGDMALFGGYSTQEMKQRLNIKGNRPLADFLPTLSIAAKNLAAEMTNYNVEEKDLRGESSITDEHVQNNKSVRKMLGERGIKPENLPPEEDIKKLERRVKAEEKKLTDKNKCFKDN
jgi:DNA-damage-inducible protein D